MVNLQESGADVVHAFFGARYYDPSSARFTQIDPVTLGLARPGLENVAGGASLQEVLGDPWRYLHPYAYAANNPLRYTDEEGNAPGEVSPREFVNWLTRVVSRYAAWQTQQSVARHAEEWAALSPRMQQIHGNDPAQHAAMMDAMEGVAFGAVGGVESGTAKVAPELAKGAGYAFQTFKEISVGTRAELKNALGQLKEAGVVSDAFVKQTLKDLSGAGYRFNAKVLADGSVKAIREIAGYAGERAHAVYVTVRDAAGNRIRQIQYGFNRAGELDHVHPKFP